MSDATGSQATPIFTERDGLWRVTASPWGDAVGSVGGCGAAGWTAITVRSHYVGLFPDKQAAGEALVKHAGYEVLR